MMYPEILFCVDVYWDIIEVSLILAWLCIIVLRLPESWASVLPFPPVKTESVWCSGNWLDECSWGCSHSPSKLYASQTYQADIPYSWQPRSACPGHEKWASPQVNSHILVSFFPEGQIFLLSGDTSCFSLLCESTLRCTSNSFYLYWSYSHFPCPHDLEVLTMKLLGPRDTKRQALLILQAVSSENRVGLLPVTVP